MNRPARYLFLICFEIINVCSRSFAQSNEGTEFWFAFLEHFDRSNNKKCIVTSKSDTKGYIEMPSINWRRDFSVTANSVFIVDVPDQSETLGSENITNNAVHVVTEELSSVYIHQYYQFRADAALVLPVSSLGSNYFVMTYHGYDNNSVHYPSEFCVVGVEDNTLVRIKYSAETLNGKKKGTIDTIQLNKGQAYQVKARRITEDLTGTEIQSDKYVALFSGNKWTQIPNGFGNRDNLLEQMYPVEVWGKQFVAVPSKTTAADRYRIMASTDNTNVTLTGKGPMPGPFTLKKGEWKEFELRAVPAFIQSDKPLMVAMFLVGGTYNGRIDNLGDPSMVLLNSIEQYRDTVTLYNSPYENITENYLNIITTVKDTATLKVDGKSIIAFNEKFQTIGPQNEFAFVQLQVPEGAHVLSTGVCGLIAIAYGYGFAESYAYGGGANFTKFNNLPIPDGSCLGDSIPFKTGLPEKRFDVLWDLGDGTLRKQHQFKYQYQSLGDYKVKLKYIDLCRNSIDSIEKLLKVTLREQLQAYPDSVVCEGDDIYLRAFDRIGSKYLWIGPDSFSSEEEFPVLKNIRLSQSGVYQVTGYFYGCPTFPHDIMIDVKANPFPYLGQDTFFCPSKNSLSLTISNYNSIRWDDNSNVSSRQITEQGNYSVSVINEFGCSGSDSITILDKCPLTLFVPNVFSPNGDLINDEFKTVFSHVQEFSMEIFTRWGEKVFSTNDLEVGWNGKNVRGEDLSPGVYVYHIFARGYNEKGELIEEDRSGDVTLVR